MFLLSASTVWLWVLRDDDKWNHVKTRNNFWLQHHLGLSLLENRMENVIHLTLLEEFLVLLLVPDDPGLKWMFSDAVISVIFWLFHLRLGIWSFRSFAALTLPLHRAFWRGILMRRSPLILHECLRPQVSFPDSTAKNAWARKKPGKIVAENWCTLHWFFEEIRWSSTIAPNGITGPLKAFRTAFHTVSSHQTRDFECVAESNNIQLNPSTIQMSRPDCNNTATERLS